MARIDALTVVWYATPTDASSEADSIAEFLVILSDYLPDALPVDFAAPGDGRRRRRFTWAERNSFYDVGAVEGNVEWTARDPFICGYVFGLGWTPEQRRTPVVEVTLWLNMQAIDDERFETNLLQAIPLAAAALGAFYAVAQANYGVLQNNRREIGADPQSRVAGSRVTDRMGWLGLPRRNVSFEWLGSHYLRIVDEAVVMRGTRASGGLLLRYRDAAERSSTLPGALLVGSLPNGRSKPAQLLPNLQEASG